jgi:hypothetical protein
VQYPAVGQISLEVICEVSEALTRLEIQIYAIEINNSVWKLRRIMGRPAEAGNVNGP